MLAVVALAALRRPPDLSAPTAGAGMLLSGVVIGAAATPEALAAAARYPGSIALLLVSMAATILGTGWVLVRFGRWNPLDALLGAAPGALSAVMAIAQEKSARIGDVAVVQLFRLFLLVAAAPGALALTGAAMPRGGVVPPAPAWIDAFIMIAAGFATGLVFRRIGIMSPMVLGGAASSTILHAADLVHGALPWPLAAFAFIAIGTIIGTRIASVSLARLRALMPLAFYAFLASMAAALLFAWPAAQAAQVGYAAAFMAFAPGGLEAMALLAVAMGFDPLYVGAHHLVRFMTVGFLLPLVAALVIRRMERIKAD